MSSLSGISASGMGTIWPSNPGSAAAPSPTGGAAASDSLNISALSYSSSSISASSESLSVSQGASASNNELLGAVLLLLMMQYMKSGDDQEKKDLLGLMNTIAQQMGQSGQSGGSGGMSLSYSSSSLNIETTNLQVISVDAGIGSYLNTQGGSGQMPGGGIDVAA